MYKTYQRHFSKPRQIFGRRRSLFGEFSGTSKHGQIETLRLLLAPQWQF